MSRFAGPRVIGSGKFALDGLMTSGGGLLHYMPSPTRQIPDLAAGRTGDALAVLVDQTLTSRRILRRVEHGACHSSDALAGVTRHLPRGLPKLSRSEPARRRS